MLTRVSSGGQPRKEYARCFSKHSIIKYNNDTIYSEEEYDNLRDNIKGGIQSLEQIVGDYNEARGVSRSTRTCVPNFMRAILVATGKKKGNIERLFTNLSCTRETNGKYTFYSETDLSKFVVFYSNHNGGFTAEGYNPDLIVRLNDLEENTVENSDIINRVGDTARSHTEPLCLSAILSLDKETFTSMLGKKYTLMYYEIHLISTMDACESCPDVIYKNIPKIKKRFGDNLFLFFHAGTSYHSDSHPDYPKLPYALKFKKDNNWKYIDGQIPNYQYFYTTNEAITKEGLSKNNFPRNKKYSLRGYNHGKGEVQLLSLISSPKYYFSFISNLENEGDVQKGAERRILVYGE